MVTLTYLLSYVCLLSQDHQLRDVAVDDDDVVIVCSCKFQSNMTQRLLLINMKVKVVMFMPLLTWVHIYNEMKL